jgi:hypothetical protein
VADGGTDVEVGGGMVGRTVSVGREVGEGGTRVGARVVGVGSAGVVAVASGLVETENAQASEAIVTISRDRIKADFPRNMLHLFENKREFHLLCATIVLSG